MAYEGESSWEAWSVPRRESRAEGDLKFSEAVARGSEGEPVGWRRERRPQHIAVGVSGGFKMVGLSLGWLRAAWLSESSGRWS